MEYKPNHTRAIYWYSDDTVGFFGFRGEFLTANPAHWNPWNVSVGIFDTTMEVVGSIISGSISEDFDEDQVSFFKKKHEHVVS